MGDREALEDIEGQIQALQHALGGSSMPDAGERAYDTVRHAIRYLTEHLRGSSEETQFAEHLRTHLSVGFECLYTHPEGVWD